MNRKFYCLDGLNQNRSKFHNRDLSDSDNVPQIRLPTHPNKPEYTRQPQTHNLPIIVTNQNGQESCVYQSVGHNDHHSNQNQTPIFLTQD